MYNLRLSSDNIYVIVGAYTKCTTYYVSTMESAAESGRRGANAIFKEEDDEEIHIFTEVQLAWYIKLSHHIDKGLWSIRLGNPLNLILNCFRHANSIDVHINTTVYTATNLGSIQ